MNIHSSRSSPDNVEFYERFAGHYQRIYACVDADETVRQWKALLDRHFAGDPRRLNLVDVGCGPGWYLSAWAKAGFEVSGIDSSPSMLSAAGRNFSNDPGGQCKVYLGDIRDFAMHFPIDRESMASTPANFDVAVTHFNFLNLFSSTDLERVFSGVASLVRPGGVWMADCSIPASPPPPVEEDYDLETGTPLSCVGVWNESSRTFRESWHGLDLDIEEVYWFHCVQAYEQCELASGWVVEARYEWCPEDRVRPWCSARGDSERVVTLYRRTPIPSF